MQIILDLLDFVFINQVFWDLGWDDGFLGFGGVEVGRGIGVNGGEWTRQRVWKEVVINGFLYCLLVSTIILVGYY